MNKSLIAVFIASFFLEATNTFAQKIITRTQHGDTAIEANVDTGNKFIKLRKDYVKNNEIAQAFSSRMVAKTVMPGDVTNPVYQSYLAEGRRLAENAKQQAITSLKAYPASLALTDLKTIEDISTCTFEPIPVYYLTHNVANYVDQSNLTPFFNLDTANLNYKIIKNNHVLGVVQYQKGRCFFWHFSGFYARSYNYILSRHKEPVIFISTIADSREISTNQYDKVGYVSKGIILFVASSEGENTMGGPDAKKGTVSYMKRDVIISAEAYYLGSDASLPNLGHFINNEYKRIKKQN